MALWWDEYFFSPENNPVLPTASTVGITTEVAVEYNQEWTASDHGNEASQFLDFDYHDAPPVTANTAMPVDIQLGSQYNDPPYQVSHVRLSVIRVHANVF